MFFVFRSAQEIAKLKNEITADQSKHEAARKIMNMKIENLEKQLEQKVCRDFMSHSTRKCFTYNVRSVRWPSGWCCQFQIIRSWVGILLHSASLHSALLARLYEVQGELL